MTDSPRSLFWARASMLLNVLIWGNSYVAIRLAMRELSFVDLIFLRLLVASFLFLVLLLLAFRKIPLPRRSEGPRVLLSAASGVVLYHLGLNYGQQFVPAGTAGILVSFSPVYTAVLAWWFLRERLTTNKILGFAVAAGGLLLVLFNTAGSLAWNDWKGPLILVADALFWSIYTLSVRASAAHNLLVYTAWIHFCGVGMLLPFCWRSVFLLPSLSPLAWGALLYLGGGCMFLANILYNRSVTVLGAGATASFLYFIPVVAVFSGAIWLGEPLDLAVVSGAALILLGIWLVNWSWRTKVASHRLHPLHPR